MLEINEVSWWQHSGDQLIKFVTGGLFVKYQLRLSVLAIRTFEPSLNFKSVWEVFGTPLQQDWNRTLGLGYQEPIV